ncbi:MAG: zf-HC2 domain-containing protein, partial [Clostridia bacterium]
MNCSHYTLLLHDLLDGTLSPERVQEMDAHAALCSDCSIQYEQLRCIVEDLQTLDVDIEVPQTFSHAWQKAVKEEAMHKKNPHRFTAWRAWIVAAAAIICLTGGTELLRSGYLPGTAPYQSRVGLSRAETTTRDADTPVM